jgi:hypothetical protein
MDLRLVLYAAYIVASVAMTVWVGRSLHRNGRGFLIDVMRDDNLADSINHLLLVGFYLVNLGAAALLINLAGDPGTAADVVKIWLTQMGLVLLTLGGMHFANLFVLHRIRRSSQARNYAEWYYKQSAGTPAAAGQATS